MSQRTKGKAAWLQEIKQSLELYRSNMPASQSSHENSEKTMSLTVKSEADNYK